MSAWLCKGREENISGEGCPILDSNPRCDLTSWMALSSFELTHKLDNSHLSELALGFNRGPHTKHLQSLGHSYQASKEHFLFLAHFVSETGCLKVLFGRR